MLDNDNLLPAYQNRYLGILGAITPIFCMLYSIDMRYELKFNIVDLVNADSKTCNYSLFKSGTSLTKRYLL